MEKPHESEPTNVTEQPADAAPAETPVAASHTPRRQKITVTAVILIAVAFLAGLAGMRVYEMTTGNDDTLTSRPTVSNDGNKVVTPQEENIANVVSKVSPAVVSIVTQSQGSSFYGPTQQESAGTGIVVSKDGYILTNKHVVSDADTVSVILSDGTTYDNVKVLGTDPLNDVAFLKIPNVSNLPVAELGDSSSIRVGQQVVAIGNSLGQYHNTVTSGIVSGTGRPISAQSGNSVENLTDLIQTDAAINPGNSGGPLLNLQGQVIGINTAIIQDAQGIGFAIPINATKGILKGVLNGQGVKRAFLGINYIPITAEVAKHYNLPVKQGAYVYTESGTPVVKGSPADQAGVKSKDIITKVNGETVGDKAGLSSIVAQYAPGDTIQLTIRRGSQTLTLKVILKEYKG